MHDAIKVLLGLLAGPYAKPMAILVVALQCLASSITSAESSSASQAQTRADFRTRPPPDVAMFDLHDPALMTDWARFLEQTPMLNEEPLPQYLKDRLTHVVGVYRTLTGTEQPAFFVATYFDVLASHLLADDGNDIRPLRICPVFTNGSGASVSSLLAVASGLPGELFANAPGTPERYHYLFLQTEYSHCRFLAAMQAEEYGSDQLPAAARGENGALHLSFQSGVESKTACVSRKEELRALLEALGDVDAVSMYRSSGYGHGSADEANVFGFARLLALLATDGKSGYAAIPVLYPLLDDHANQEYEATAGCLQVADALVLAYKARAAFRQLVPFAIGDAESLLAAKLNVMAALSEEAEYSGAADERLTALLERFVTDADLLLSPTLAYEKMPPVKD